MEDLKGKRVRILKDIPELVSLLRAQKARVRDRVVPVEKVSFSDEGGKLALSFDGAAYGVQDQVHEQLAERFGISGRYYGAMREKEAVDLLATNLNYWAFRQAGEKRLVRLVDGDVRAFLSNRYRPIDHLDIATVAIMAVTGKDGHGGEEKPWARGAKAFDWALSPKRMSVGFVNPSMVVDLNRLEKGVQILQPAGDVDGRDGGTGFVYAGGRFMRSEWGGGSHMVFPAAFVSNSETGFGLASVEAGLYEAVCDNAARIGTNLAQRHIGKALENEDFYSPETLKKMNEVIFGQVADVFRSVFDPAHLLTTARKMKGLKDVDMEIKDAADKIVALPGMTEDLRDDILSSYQPLGKKETLLDVQRAVTAAAHIVRASRPETAEALETLGGAIIEKGLAALVS